MATYYYSLLSLPDKLPVYENRVGIDALTDNDATNWIIANDPNFIPGSRAIYLRKISSLEGGDRGFATDDGLGRSTDAAVAAGADGSLNAKVKLLTTQVDNLSTTVSTLQSDVDTIKNQELPFTNALQGLITGPASSELEIKAGVSRLSTRRGYILQNLDISNPVYIGPTGVQTSGATQGRKLGANEQIFDPFGDVGRFVIGDNALNLHVEEVE